VYGENIEADKKQKQREMKDGLDRLVSERAKSK